jgi:hypothetical protein
MHNQDNILVQLGNAGVNIWKTRSADSRPRLFNDAAAEWRS